MNSKNLSSAELCRLSQTDVTSDAAAGYNYALEAFEQAKSELDQVKAARQAGIRGIQYGDLSATRWFDTSSSIGRLAGLTREVAASDMLHGRASSLIAISNDIPGGHILSFEADANFLQAEDELKAQHTRGGKWDRFGSMLTKFRATHEAIQGDAVFGMKTAIRGIWRAIRADSEQQKAQEHIKFVTKQLGGNALAGALAATRPAENIPRVQKYRRTVAQKILG